MASTTCPQNGHDRISFADALSAGDEPSPRYREVLETIRTVSSESKPMISVAIIGVDQVNS
jgi:hypothetical protein